MNTGIAIHNGQKLLSGPERVAALLLAMGKGPATRILKHFNAEEIRSVTKSAAGLGHVPTAQIAQLVDEFAQSFSTGADLVGNAAEIEILLSGVLTPEQVTELMAEVIGSANRNIWDRISSVSENVIAAYLMKEHPQTAALVLSKVKASCAARVMAHMPHDVRNSLMRRMLSMKPIVDETMKNIEAILQEDFMTNFSKNAGSDTHARMAEIINKMDRDHMEDVLTDLSNVRPKSAEILKSLLFTFDDIVKINPRDRVALFDKVPADKLVLALKGTSDEFRGVILTSLSSRVRRMVEHELSNRDPAPQRDVAEARRTITDQALEMASVGEITINAENEDDASVF